ncbi:hypothetical protein, partial [Phaeodactylibacter luteus]
ESISLISPPELTVSVTASAAGCGGAASGSAEASAAGGAGSYSYAWSNGATGPSLTGLASGAYTVTVTDG